MSKNKTVSTVILVVLLSACTAHVSREEHDDPDAKTDGFEQALSSLCWVAYSPTRFDPTTTPITWPSEEDVSADLQVLHRAGFRGLVTYGSNYRDARQPDETLDVAGLAQQAGFEGVILGVWDPSDERELNAARDAAVQPVVLGYSVGNEGLESRYDLQVLTTAMQYLRDSTAKPVTTTEELHDYDQNSPIWNMSDWVFANAHPFFAGRRDPEEAVAWTERVFEALVSVSDKPVVFKEVGLPSAGDEDVSEAKQAEYYRRLRETGVVFVVFEAFDAPWKRLPARPNGAQPLGSDPEPHWGIFTNDRTAKPAAAFACPDR